MVTFTIAKWLALQFTTKLEVMSRVRAQRMK